MVGQSTIIDVWTGCSAVCAALSIFLAQWDAICDASYSSNPDMARVNDEMATLDEKLMALNRLVKSWHAYGEITFDQHTQLNIDSSRSQHIGNNMMDALLFVIAHELGHHFLGHLNENRDKRPNQNEKHRQEYEADRDGANTLLTTSSNTFNMGPILVFMAASILSKGPDTRSPPPTPAIAGSRQRLPSADW
jgi:hypothetical protein